MRVAAVSANPHRSGRREVARYTSTFRDLGVDLAVFPSRILPAYVNPGATYTREHIETRACKLSPGKTTVIAGVDEAVVVKARERRYLAVAAMRQGRVVGWHRKRRLEDHHKSTYSCGPDNQPGSVVVIEGGVKLQMLECWECLHGELWRGDVDIVTVSIGFGMDAKTDHYECDYWDQWAVLVSGACLRQGVWAVLACHDAHLDQMTAVISPEGKVVGCARSGGVLVMDIEATAKARREKNPLAQSEG